MKSVVITGSTSGLGLGMADAFLARGCNVAISGRSQANLDDAHKALLEKHNADQILACRCDVSRYDEVEALWDAAAGRFTTVDIWINNAGAGHPQTPIWDYSCEMIDRIVAANVTGVLYGLKVASSRMLKQGTGSIYNMEGLGSSGPMIKGLALYASTKAGLAYLTRAAARDVKNTSLIVGGLRPGMVATKLITDQYAGKPEEWARVEWIFNILSDRVETVAPWLVDRILANKKNGVVLDWLNMFRIAGRFLLSPVRKRRVYG